jgi:aspartyl-tRNA(Asn)/glutamyl-tRNA(Gln) amidotransferase subunit C
MSQQKTSSADFDIDHIAKLAHLSLTPEEKKTFRKQLTGVLDYFKKLQEVDTDKVEPTFQVISDMHSRFQEQELEADTLKQEDVLQNARLKKDGYVGTKGVL